ncbi:B-cell antigen receptor complex-associated protein alpha chain [Anguilla anguilla]|uniref:B-cell antigen receptor complex-associated protein alpha chain n=1 Tax=Anguilla anguilla TaxID=7936 RepID=UPI0015AB8A7A|nr:B-cell antigen receptor complex-associated protein alpha chain [Anguilla anguilla]
MILRSILLLLWCADVTHGNLDKVTLYKDQPLLRAEVSSRAELLCCYNGSTVEPTWLVTVTGRVNNGTNYNSTTRKVEIDEVRLSQPKKNVTRDGTPCHMLEVKEVHPNDTGLYRCLLSGTGPHPHTYTHGTYLQVYMRTSKILNISESAKNRIILTEAILLLLCVLVPGIPLLFKKKKLNELEKKKNTEEEENIYEGLNLDDFTSTYHQIQRSQVCSPYQDVDNVQGEDFQLEKP